MPSAQRRWMVDHWGRRRRPRARLVARLRAFLGAQDEAQFSPLDLRGLVGYGDDLMSDDEARAPGGQPGNRNAAKEADECLHAILHLKVSTGEKNAWVKKAQKAGMKLAPWVRMKLNSTN